MRTKTVVKYVFYSLLMLLLYAFQVTPGMFRIGNVSPVLVVPLCVCIAVFERELPAAAFGILAGMLWDLSSNKVFGFYTAILLCCCVAVSLAVTYYVRVKLLNAVLFCLAATAAAMLMGFAFYYVLWSYEGTAGFLLGHIVPTVLYTAAMSVPVYFMVRAVAGRFGHARI